MSLPDRLRAARQAARMTQSKGRFCADPHTRKNVCKWEHGRQSRICARSKASRRAWRCRPCWLAFGCEVDRHGK